MWLCRRRHLEAENWSHLPASDALPWLSNVLARSLRLCIAPRCISSSSWSFTVEKKKTERQKLPPTNIGHSARAWGSEKCRVFSQRMCVGVWVIYCFVCSEHTHHVRASLSIFCVRIVVCLFTCDARLQIRHHIAFAVCTTRQANNCYNFLKLIFFFVAGRVCEWCGAIICASTSAWQLPTHAHYASTATRPAAADRYSLHGTRRTGRPIWASPKNGGRGGRPHNGQVVGGHILPQGVCTQVQVSSSCQGMQRKKRFLSVGHICNCFLLRLLIKVQIISFFCCFFFIHFHSI